MKLGVHRRRCAAFSACFASMSSTLPMLNRSGSHQHPLAFVALTLTRATFFALTINEFRLARKSGEMDSAACGGRFSWLRKR